VEILVCIKRVPQVGGRVVLTADSTEIETRTLGFTMSPHEECAVEEAVRLIEANGGTATAITVGPAESEEQLRYAMSLGLGRSVLVDAGDEQPGPQRVAAEIVTTVLAQRQAGEGPDLILLGNEAPDSGDYQVGIRVAESLGLPCVTGIKEISVSGGRLRATRERGAAREVFEVPLPAVCTVKEGLNLPRYPSLPGRLRAKNKPIEHRPLSAAPDHFRKIRLGLPLESGRKAELLGHGASAAPRIVEVLVELGVVGR
jgi:electron transfer flavoprotein beta subunit